MDTDTVKLCHFPENIHFLIFYSYSIIFFELEAQNTIFLENSNSRTRDITKKISGGSIHYFHVFLKKTVKFEWIIIDFTLLQNVDPITLISLVWIQMFKKILFSIYLYRIF